MQKLWKRIEYNSPVILTFSLICIISFILNHATGGWLNKTLLITYGHSKFGLLTILRSFLHIFGHANLEHLTGNLTLLLLVGPIAEEKYQSKPLCVMIAVTAVVTAIINGIFFNNGIMGASGIVFMMIILSAFPTSSSASRDSSPYGTNSEPNKIPLTLILVCLVYLGKEIIDGIFLNDSVSQLGHITGGVSGLAWGFFMKKKS